MSSQSDLTATCPHISTVRSNLSNIRHSLPHRPISCSTCHTSPPRLYVCVTCSTVACPLHVSTHAHPLSIDIDRLQLFCSACRDQVYDSAFDAQFIPTVVIGPPEKKRRRVDYKPWCPDLKEQALIAENSTVIDVKDPWGLRGLCNLGNTCFMNSVLQALLHTPPVRNYFLSDKHNRFYCERENKTIVTRHSESGVGDNNSNKTKTKKKSDNGKKVDDVKLCLACDLDAIYSAVFGGDRLPYSPAKFLYSWWQHASNLASYEQQDAHEFFISMLDGIHEKLQKDKRKTHSHGSGDCCIAHRTFSGILRSDVMCTSCGFTSTTYDPCVDISLDLEPSHTSPTKKSKSNSSANKDTDPISTLTGCLDRFTRPERLGSDQKFFCQQCQVRQESLKQMSIRKLPLVSCFHIKRFEHSHIRKMSRKVDRYLQFPFSLNMAPYLSSSILRSRYGNRIFPVDEDEGDGVNEYSAEFELFAVITHSGKLDAGHYVTYLRLNNHWYKCDDAWITRVNDSIVRSAQGYMMFYVQKMLYYRASERPGAA